MKIGVPSLRVKVFLVLPKWSETPKVLQLLPATTEEMHIPLCSDWTNMKCQRDQKKWFSPEGRPGGLKPGTFSPLGKARQALSEASIPASFLSLREAPGPCYRQREEEGEGKCPHPHLWYIFSSPSVIYVIRRPQTLFFQRSCRPLSACWRLFIHTSWCGMIASSTWPPCIWVTTESS